MGIIRYRLKIKETVATLITDEKYIPVAEKEVIRQRKLLENYISDNPDFLFSLEPYSVSEDSPEIVRKMALASSIAGVGPMASVAGAIAYFAVKEMVRRGATHVIFDNGGDIAMFINRPVTVGIYSGKKFQNLGLRFEPRGLIIGVCTSSGKMGHSLSFGRADSATVISEDPVLADAVATSLCNSVKNEDPEKIEEAINRFLSIKEIEGAIVIMGELIGLGGKLPEIVSSRVPIELITKSCGAMSRNE